MRLIIGTRLRHIDGSQATVCASAHGGDYPVSVETDSGLAENWPRDEIAGFGTIELADECPECNDGEIICGPNGYEPCPKCCNVELAG